MTAKPESIARIVWRAVTSDDYAGVARISLVFGPLGLAITLATLAWRHWAYGSTGSALYVRWIALTWGFWLLIVAGRIGRRVAQKWPAAGGEVPSAVVAAPVLAALGAASLGLSGAMQVAVSSNPGQEFWGPVPAWIPMFGFLSVFLTIELLRVSRTTRALYVWAGEQAASVAEARAAAEHARLTALQAQMSPAFLFNALNTVITLARSDTPRAERVVERLSGVLRRGLKRTAESMSSVDDEVQFIREYLDVEGERLESRLHVTFALDPEAASVFVPTGCLQTLVENAVKFAVSRQPAGGHIRVVTERLDDKVRLAVEDDGPRFSPERLEASGIGSLRERLHGIYGEAAEIYTGTPFTGARVMITLPVSAPAGIGQ